MTELLPCPFCGGEAQVQHQSRELYGDVVDWYGVYCKKQFCGYVSGQSTEAEAVAAWNTRAERTCHVNELDTLTQTLSMANGCSWGECSECGCLTPTDSVFCVECGAKVVG